MKKFAIVIIALLFIQQVASSQSCLPEGIIFTTQAEIDSFQTNYPNCTEIEGDVEINGDDITNLNGLNVLTAFGGSILIGNWYSGNPVLTSLTGLNNLSSIVEDFWILSNDSLISLSGLDNLDSIGGELMIRSNIALTSLTDLNNVTSIGGTLSINYNDALTNLIGLYNVTSIGGNIRINDNDALINLTGLDNVTSIGGYLRISYNDALTSLTGLNNLSSIGKALWILFNDSLISLTGLDNLDSIGGDLGIIDNPVLTSLTGLDNIDEISIGNLTIIDNNSLTNCEVESICNYLSNPNGTVIIHSNASGCNNPPEVGNGCGTTLSCLPYGNYYFFTQSEIDDFQTDYPDCTDLIGLVEINGSNITNLNGLNVIKAFWGTLWIHNNDTLTSITGLNNVTFIEEHLSIVENNALTSLTGLDNLDSIRGALGISDNAVLTGLTELDNLTSVGDGLIITYNGALTSLTGLDNIDAGSITDLYIYYNPFLSTCEVQSVCNYLASPNGLFSIVNNATGCNNQEEVEAACEAISVESLDAKDGLSVYPNPLSTLTIIEYELIEAEKVSLTIYNHLGQQVETLVNKHQQIGKHQVTWNAEGLSSGIYFYRFTAGNQSTFGKMIVVK